MPNKHIDIAAIRSGLVYTRKDLVSAIESLNENLLDVDDVLEILFKHMDALEKLALGQEITNNDN